MNDVISKAVRREVEARLERIETEEGVRVFYACESGSRAWGFPSADSDYDVRFLYLHPRAWYLSIDLERKRDVIERPIVDEIDLGGWDLRKALGLFRKSNPPLLEWLTSPLVYREVSSVAEQMRDLARTYYSPRASFHHYLHMARANFKDYLQRETVWTKKYFYVLRPLLGMLWIERDLGPVPMAFDVLVDRLVDDPALRRAIDDLLAAKRSGAELDRGPRIEVVSAFIEAELDRLEGLAASLGVPKAETEPLNALFRAALDEVWGG